MQATLKKTDIIEGLKSMPEEIPLDDLIEKLIFIEKVKSGLKSADQRPLTSHEDVKKLSDEW